MTIGRDDRLGNNWFKPGDEELEREEMEENGGGRGAEVIPQQGMRGTDQTKDLSSHAPASEMFSIVMEGK